MDSSRTLGIALAAAWDWEGFRHSARALLRHGVPPAQVAWRWPEDAHLPGTPTDLFSDAGDAPIAADAVAAWLARHHPVPDPAGAACQPRLSAALLDDCQHASLHRSADRFVRLYRWLYRIGQTPQLKGDPLDADAHAIAHMAKAVRRERHKMRAFVRFRPLAQPDSSVQHVAWFEPEHHVIVANAPFFIRRFANMHWRILSPQACLHWDGERLHIAPGAAPHQAPAADAGEDLWLAYYATTFNPARLKPSAMLREMPRKYWHNLPEARLISPLVAQAGERSGTTAR